MGCSQSKEVVETVKPQPPEVPAKIPEEQVVMGAFFAFFVERHFPKMFNARFEVLKESNEAFCTFYVQIDFSRHNR